MLFPAEAGLLLLGNRRREGTPGGRARPGRAGAQGAEGGRQQGKLAPSWGGSDFRHGDPLPDESEHAVSSNESIVPPVPAPRPRQA
ncbi:MAG: hypothetical protein HC869_26450 [Rhodospirillales bacterium]|nr:hypothetical protein [Rhodospirillales bacterium]